MREIIINQQRKTLGTDYTKLYCRKRNENIYYIVFCEIGKVCLVDIANKFWHGPIGTHLGAETLYFALQCKNVFIVLNFGSLWRLV